MTTLGGCDTSTEAASGWVCWVWQSDHHEPSSPAEQSPELQRRNSVGYKVTLWSLGPWETWPGLWLRRRRRSGNFFCKKSVSCPAIWQLIWSPAAGDKSRASRASDHRNIQTICLSTNPSSKPISYHHPSYHRMCCLGCYSSDNSESRQGYWGSDGTTFV